MSVWTQSFVVKTWKTAQSGKYVFFRTLMHVEGSLKIKRAKLRKKKKKHCFFLPLKVIKSSLINRVRNKPENILLQVQMGKILAVKQVFRKVLQITTGQVHRTDPLGNNLVGWNMKLSLATSTQDNIIFKRVQNPPYFFF